MASFFTIGERKTRPGVYFRYENAGTPPIAGADDGTVAVTVRSDWGPVGKAVLAESAEDVERTFGTGGTTGIALEAFKGGARRAYVVRLGAEGDEGGKCGQYEIMSTSDHAVLTLALRNPGKQDCAVTIRKTLADEAASELILTSGTRQLHRLEFPNDTGNDVKALMEAYQQQGENEYFTLGYTFWGYGDASDVMKNGNKLKEVTQGKVTGGEAPQITNGAYSAAFGALEAYRWNVLALDTEDASVQSMAQLFLNRIYQGGRFCMGVFGEPSTSALEDRMKRASAFNDYQVAYVGNGFVDAEGTEHEGAMAAARVAGMIAGTPSSESITHAPVDGAVGLTEALTNAQHEQAIKAGMLAFSTSAAGTVWVEQGINTLVSPGHDEDEGWKKIKRAKVRFELFQRLNDTVEGLVGRIGNDPDGRMTVVQCCNGVCNAMVAEKKLLAGAYVEVDPDNAPAGDSAWFLVHADDVDSLEKLYFTFRFRFAPDEAE